VLELTLLVSESSFAIKHKLASSSFFDDELLPSYVGSSCFASLLKLFVCPFLFALIVWTNNLDVSLFTTFKHKYSL